MEFTSLSNIIATKQINFYVGSGLMKKRVSILTLTFLFFTATTGLPISLNFCRMMESDSPDCKIHKGKVVKISSQETALQCCENVSNAEIYFTNGYELCCLTKIVDTSVNEDFILSKTDFTLKTYLSITLIVNQNSFFSDNSSQRFYFNISPPSLKDNHIYLTKSVLLI